jgi:transcription-repair coupling factor (superfamily II helicase)
VIRLVQSEPQVYRLDGADRLRFHRDLPTLTERVDVVSALLDSLQLSDAA